MEDAYFALIRETRAQVRSHMAHESDHAVVARTMTFLFQTYDTMLKEFERTAPWACHRGCAHCCHNPVGVTGLEALWIGETLRNTLGPKDLADVVEGLRTVARKQSGSTWDLHALGRHPCLFLLPDHSCGIYPWRPLGCRSLVSFSEAACSRAFSSNQSSSAFDQRPLLSLGALVSGLSLALRDLGLSSARYELHGAVLATLEHDQPVHAWRTDNTLFSDCLPGDALDPDTHARILSRLDKLMSRV